MVLPYQQAANCPAGQNFYSCYSGSYEGCCSHDPCISGMCDSSNPSALCVPQTLTITQIVTSASTTLTSTSQPTDAFTPVVSFGLDAVTSASSQSTTITLAVSGTLSDAPTTIASSVPIATAGGTGTTSATTTASDKTTLTSTPTSSTAPKIDTSNPHTVPRAGPIAGGILGGLSALALITFLIFFCCRRRNKLTLKLRKKNSRDPVSPTGDEQKDKQKYIKETEEFLNTRAAALRQSTYVKSLDRFDFGSGVKGGQGEGGEVGRRAVETGGRDVGGRLPEIGRGSPLGSPRSWI